MNANIADTKSEGNEHPYKNASFIARCSFWWLKNLFRAGLQKPLESKDIYRNLESNGSALLMDKFEKCWSTELSRADKKPSLRNVIWKTCVSKFIGWSFLYSAIDIFLRVAQSQCVGRLVIYFAKTKDDANYILPNVSAVWYAVGLISCALISSSLTNSFLMQTFQIGLQVRVAFCSMIYNKALKLPKSSPISKSNGKLINLLAFDTYRFDTMVSLLHHLWKGPIEVIVFGYILYNEIGFYSWIGIALIICFVPIQITMGKTTAKYRYRMVKQTDARIRILNEIIQGIQTIKMYAWEKPFTKLIQQIRKKELEAIRGIFVVRGILCSFTVVSRLAIFATFVSYVYLGNVFNPRQVFVIISSFNFLYDSMLYYWTVAFTTFAECLVSIERMQDFLLEPKADHENVEKYSKKSDEPKYTHINGTKLKSITFKDGTARWSSGPGISGVNLQVLENELITISGSIAAGKSTILLVVLGELEIDHGQLVVNGVVSYSSQEPWLFDATIRQNIIFCEPYDAQRYQRIIRICALERDLQSMPAADLTIVGDSGICLSGGQKSRISLARAIYRKADIYLLDDPFSAVDSAVAKFVFISIKEFLKDKICIMVSQQEQHLKASNRTIFIQNGRIQCQKQNFNAEDAISAAVTVNAGADSKPCWNIISASSEVNKAYRQQVEEHRETQATGAVNNNVYLSYLKSVDSPILICVVIILFVVGQLAISRIDLTITNWVNWEIRLNATSSSNVSSLNITTSTNSSSSDNTSVRKKYIYEYTILIAIVLYLVFQRSLALYLFCLKASRRIHERMLDSVIRAKMSFFHKNSSGRIVNRFSKDLYDTDYYLALVLYDIMLICLQSVMSLILVALTNLWVLIATLGVSLIFVWLRYVYVNTARCLRRIDALGRSAIISHMNATLSGLATIRATNSESVLMSEFNWLQDTNTSVCFIFKAATRAIAFWLELTCIAYMTVAIVIFFVLEKSISGGNVGLAITQILSLISLSQWGVRQTAELENNMTSVERVMEYVDLVTEESPQKASKFDQSKDDPINAWSLSKSILNAWPSSGSIEFVDVCLKYAENGDNILKSFNMKVNSGEKVAIVGRTGAGKSSIVNALFRMADTTGVIRIDSIDISQIPLPILRSKLSIIPQDVVLFSGTVRYNLDPFSEKSDDELWRALEQVELKTFIQGLPNSLNTTLADSGHNVSAGQRSLIAIARAILSQNKILIFDEATANLDKSTDRILQRIIQKQFANCTVLTISHRLHTVMASDRILVMDGGQAVEFNHAHCLLQNADGFLTKLVDETGAKDARYLKELARINYEQKFNLKK